MAQARYFCINPGTFDDKVMWQLEDLQTLCKSLNMSDAGDSKHIVSRLRRWHRIRRPSGPLSRKPCGNFACVAVKMFDEHGTMLVDECLLKPLLFQKKEGEEEATTATRSQSKKTRKKDIKRTVQFSPYNHVLVFVC